MNRTQLLSLGSALGLTLKKSPSSAPVDVPTAAANNKHHLSKSIELEDDIGPLTASPPASPATRLSSSSASFFPTTTNNTHHNRSGGNKHLPIKDLNRIGSFAAHNLPKLRESKWFTENEARIFCVVAEVGFIVEIRRAVEVTPPEQGSAGGAKEYKSLFGVVTKKECINQSAEGV